MKKKILISVILSLLMITCFSAFNTFAESGDTSSETKGKIEFSRDYAEYEYSDCGTQMGGFFSVYPENPNAEITITSSDPSVLTIGTIEKRVYFDNSVGVSFYYTIRKPGKAVAEIECEGVKAEFPIFCHPKPVTIESVETTGNKKVTLKWKKTEGVDGYLITRYKDWPYDYESNVIKTVYGAGTTSVEVAAALNKRYYYRVTSFYSYNNSILLNRYWSEEVEHNCQILGTVIKSVNVSGNKMVIDWEPTPGASGYEVCRSLYEEDGYEKIGSVSGSVHSFTDKPKAGTVWHYGIKPVFSDGKGIITNTYAQIVPVKKAKKASSIKNKKIKLYEEETETMYRDGNTLYFVIGTISRKGKIELKVTKLNNSYKAKSTKTIKIKAKKGAIYKGLYHGPDGNNYVFVTYPNPKDNENKIVAQILRYNKKWKKTGTASLKSGGGYGISGACVLGRPAFSLHGNTLFIHTSRYHLTSSDGLRHESNLTIRVDLKKMKARYRDISGSYASHSFAQKMRIKGDTIYLADLGDAYPRGIQVCIGNSSLDDNEQDVAGKGEYVTFKFRGKTGSNYTGASLNGMEIGKNKIVIAGVSVPHNHPVNGVKGFKNRTQNLYVNIIDRKTGKAKVVWLTRYNPKKTEKEFEYTNMVKLSENRFAILVSINQRLNYYLIDENGKIIKHIKYKKSFKYAPMTAPIVHNGSIVWPMTHWTDDWRQDRYIKMCRIPVVL